MSARDGNYSNLKHALKEIFPDSVVELRPSQSRGHVLAVQADVHLAAGQLHLWIELLESVSNARLLDAAELLRLSQDDVRSSVRILAAPYLSPSRQQLLRDAHAAFIDYAGNAWIMAPGVHVDRRGFRNPGREEREQRDLFSDKASLVVRTLLSARQPLGVRQLADMVSSKDEQIQLSPGYVSKVIKELERRGYAAKRGEGIVLRHASELLNEWLISYRKRKLPVSRGYFIAAPNAESLMPKLAHALDARQLDYVFTGHAGASVVDRHADFDVVDVYVKDIEKAHMALSEIGARVVERGANVNVSLPYYRESAFYDAQMREAIRVAADIQLYLDLYDYPVRGREQAEHLYERRLRQLVDKDDQL